MLPDTVSRMEIVVRVSDYIHRCSIPVTSLTKYVYDQQAFRVRAVRRTASREED